MPCTLSRRALLQRLQNVRGVAFHGNAVPDLPNVAVFANPERHSHDSEIRFPKKSLHAPRAVRFNRCKLRIRKQGKIQFVPLFEFRLRRYAIRAAADNDRVQRFEFLFCVPKLGRFVSSARRQRLREKIKDHVLAAIVGERDLTAVVRGQPERRSLFPFFQSGHAPTPRPERA
jgi:hypothetical protein